jgi:hypothetical protein
MELQSREEKHMLDDERASSSIQRSDSCEGKDRICPNRNSKSRDTSYERRLLDADSSWTTEAGSVSRRQQPRKWPNYGNFQANQKGRL